MNIQFNYLYLNILSIWLVIKKNVKNVLNPKWIKLFKKIIW